MRTKYRSWLHPNDFIELNLPEVIKIKRRSQLWRPLKKFFLDHTFKESVVTTENIWTSGRCCLQ
ncbi:hypothetical protein, partial [Paenibacillus etheri]|uniref:hypothetical protein n=1 Tax=Paenibacillus etheri TaxID=1306852 RepID=UPI001ADEE98F